MDEAPRRDGPEPWTPEHEAELPDEVLLADLNEWDRARVRRFLRDNPDFSVADAIEAAKTTY